MVMDERSHHVLDILKNCIFRSYMLLNVFKVRFYKTFVTSKRANVWAAFSNLKKTINDDWRIESIFVSLETIINDLDWWIHVQRRENLPAWIDITISQAFSRYRDGWDESSSSSTCNGEEGSQSQSLNHCCTWRSVQLSVDGPNNKARSAASRVDQIPGSKITGFNWQVFFYLFSCRYLHVWIFWRMRM